MQFIIQSDFILQANREDIVQNDWNKSLLNEVALAFRDAVEHFCASERLITTWMRYLPNESLSDFWAPLRSKILSALKPMYILRPWSGIGLRKPADLKFVPTSNRDKDGEPLFRDLINELYLSNSYNYNDWQSLKSLSCKMISDAEVIARIQVDLIRSDSRMKASTTCLDWHSRSAKLLCDLLNNFPARTRTAVEALDIVPLQNGDWVSSNSISIYYPFSNQIPVPGDLGLRLLDAEALRNTSRSSLFAKLGVQSVKPSEVIKMILKKYNHPGVTLQQSISHLRYLYHYLTRDHGTLNKLIYMHDQNRIPTYRAHVTYGNGPIVDDLYFETDDEFGAKALFADPSGVGTLKSTATFYPVHFLHSSYLDAVPADTRLEDMSWEAWLHDVAEVRYVPRLVRSSDPTKLSPIFQAIVDKLPSKLVPCLHAHWSEYCDLIEPQIEGVLRSACVDCEGGLSDCTLERSYLPTKLLKDSYAELDLKKSPVSFLKLPLTLRANDCQELCFLSLFGVGYEPTIDFLLEVLRACTEEPESLLKTPLRSMRKIYEAVARLSKIDDYERIRYEL